MVVTVMTVQRYTLSAWAGKGRRDIGTVIGAGPNEDFIQIDAAVIRDNSRRPDLRHLTDPRWVKYVFAQAETAAATSAEWNQLF